MGKETRKSIFKTERQQDDALPDQKQKSCEADRQEPPEPAGNGFRNRAGLSGQAQTGNVKLKIRQAFDETKGGMKKAVDGKRKIDFYEKEKKLLAKKSGFGYNKNIKG